MYYDTLDAECPECGAFIQYSSLEYADESLVYYPWECEECGCEGREFHEVTFIGSEIRKHGKEVQHG